MKLLWPVFYGVSCATSGISIAYDWGPHWLNMVVVGVLLLFVWAVIGLGRGRMP